MSLNYNYYYIIQNEFHTEVTYYHFPQLFFTTWFSITFSTSAGKMEAGTCFPEDERLGEAAHRLVQLLHQPRHQEDRPGQREGAQ